VNWDLTFSEQWRCQSWSRRRLPKFVTTLWRWSQYIPPKRWQLHTNSDHNWPVWTKTHYVPSLPHQACTRTHLLHTCQISHMSVNCNTSTCFHFIIFNKYKLLLQFYIHSAPNALLQLHTIVFNVSPHYNHRTWLLTTRYHFSSTKWEGAPTRVSIKIVYCTNFNSRKKYRVQRSMSYCTSLYSFYLLHF
jgi:hypothetical protein